MVIRRSVWPLAFETPPEVRLNIYDVSHESSPPASEALCAAQREPAVGRLRHTEPERVLGAPDVTLQVWGPLPCWGGDRGQGVVLWHLGFKRGSGSAGPTGCSLLRLPRSVWGSGILNFECHRVHSLWTPGRGHMNWNGEILWTRLDINPPCERLAGDSLATYIDLLTCNYSDDWVIHFE